MGLTMEPPQGEEKLLEPKILKIQGMGMGESSLLSFSLFLKNKAKLASGS